MNIIVKDIIKKIIITGSINYGNNKLFTFDRNNYVSNITLELMLSCNVM